MKKKQFVFYLALPCTLILSNYILSGCSDDLNSSIVSANTNAGITTRNTYSNDFDWENSTVVTMPNGNGADIKVDLPWQLGASNSGIPSDWIDENIEDEYSKRMYTRKNYWELVYSNVYQDLPYKYIVLYNKMTGYLRCFYCTLSAPATAGTTNSVWGIGANTSTSLFNFTTSIAEDASRVKYRPVYIGTPVSTISNSKYSSVGYTNSVWYGLEVECAYDPKTVVGEGANLYLMGRAIDKITYNGMGTSTGNIEGSITSTSRNGAALSLNFSDMFNTNNSIVTNQNSVVGAVGDQIANGVAKKEPFYTSLWGNIKSNASKWITSGLESGVKQGLSAIVSGGGSLIANSLGNLFGSISGGRSNVSKVDLKMTLNSKYRFDAEKILPGWNDKTLPIPGTKLETKDNKPLYNEVLGVWNIKSVPQINLDLIYVQQTTKDGVIIPHDDENFTYAEYQSVPNQSLIALNPVVGRDFYITNFSCRVAKPLKDVENFAEPALLNAEPYYIGNDLTQKSSLSLRSYSFHYAGSKKGLVEIKFNLVNRTDNNIVFFYKKYFRADVNLKSEKTVYKIKGELDPSVPYPD
ncbi:hypothetical protein [uncultured Bacteroides sp.]|uniref:hypothetical protein n=1 Tax=uncultured Bacteroides sp. TaxID=162156 RepID=UPI002AAA752A|nr:hypothetical protein [uncultured Bacteroides sp.]